MMGLRLAAALASDAVISGMELSGGGGDVFSVRKHHLSWYRAQMVTATTTTTRTKAPAEARLMIRTVVLSMEENST